MRVRVMGSAAGGGFPQWNCACAGCTAVRNHEPGYRARTQAQLALQGLDGGWHLLGGSPDLRAQLLANPDMLAQPTAPRASPLQSMTLLNADIDHTLGLLLLRESHRLCVYATDFVRGALLEGNSYFAMLKQFEGQCAWRPLTEGAGFELRGQGNVASGIFCAGFELGGAPPFWAKERFTSGVGAVSGMTFESAGRRVGYFPSVPEFDGKLRDTLASCEVIFVDGTFWTDTELPELRGAGRTARQMGHVPMSETLKTLSALPLAVKKYFIHINNTNPALNEKGAQYASLRTAGWELAYDGLELNL